MMAPSKRRGKGKQNNGRNRESDPRRVAAAELTHKTMTLRLAGFTFQQISDQLGKTKAGIIKAFWRGMDEIHEEIVDDAARARNIELRRLDSYLAKIAPAVQRGDLKAIDRALKIQERRARLMGLDKPIKVAPTDPSGDNPAPSAVFTFDVDGAQAPEPEG